MIAEEQAKIKFFALHLGCEVEFDNGEIQTLISVNYPECQIETNVQWGEMTGCKLILTDLKKITDDDLKQVVKIMEWNENEFVRISFAEWMMSKIKSYQNYDLADFLRSHHYHFQETFLGYKTENWITIK